MDSATVTTLLLSCAPLVHPGTAQALIHTESAGNPYAIGVVGGQLERQPMNPAEALATATQLHRQGWNFSVGLAQINVRNFPALGLDVLTAFDACRNLAAMQTVLLDCFERAGKASVTKEPVPRSGDTQPKDQQSLRQALSCYYSGNFKTGFEHGYVQRVLRSAALQMPPRPPSTASAQARAGP
jgi:type IV secretion system protein VirB1